MPAGIAKGCCSMSHPPAERFVREPGRFFDPGSWALRVPDSKALIRPGVISQLEGTYRPNGIGKMGLLS